MTDSDSAGTNQLAILNTQIQLMAQRLGYLEADVNRLGDKTRTNSVDIQTMKNELTKTDELQKQTIERIQLDLSVVFNRFWTVMLGLIGTVLALLVQSVIRK
jgi:archaellum component FlaC